MSNGTRCGYDLADIDYGKVVTGGQRLADSRGGVYVVRELVDKWNRCWGRWHGGAKRYHLCRYGCQGPACEQRPGSGSRDEL